MAKDKKAEKADDLPKNPEVTRHAGPEPIKETPLPPDVDQNQIQVIMQTLRQIKRPLSAAPTNTPQNLLQQFELYENGSTRRVYFWVNGTWRYAALT